MPAKIFDKLTLTELIAITKQPLSTVQNYDDIAEARQEISRRYAKWLEKYEAELTFISYE